MPWRPGGTSIPCNHSQILSRLQQLKTRLNRDPDLLEEYVHVVESYLSQGHARRVESGDGHAKWMLPHHPVLHPLKLGKVSSFRLRSIISRSLVEQRITFWTRSATIGVLLRFRLGRIAFTADIQLMFHQVYVAKEDQDFLRFLWWPRGNTSQPPEEYCMVVHLFGAKSSPSCANFALLQTAEDNSSDFCPAVLDTVNCNFYVDDCLKSVDSEAEAIGLINELIMLLRRVGFDLKEVVDQLPDCIVQCFTRKSCRLIGKPRSRTRRRNMCWASSGTTLISKYTNMRSKPFTRRGILSVVSSVFDPLGMLAPVILVAKIILQDLCRASIGWDDEVDEQTSSRWKEWLAGLPRLSHVAIKRCLFSVTVDLSSCATMELHFADASSKGLAKIEVSSPTQWRFINSERNVTMVRRSRVSERT